MSKGGSGSGGSGTSQTNQTNAPPTWYSNAQTDLYHNSMDVADNLNAQQVAQVAPLNGGQVSNINDLQSNVGAGQGNYNTALGTLNGLQGYQNQNVQAGQLSNTDLSPYLNPYTQDVINTTMATGNQALAQAQNQGAATAAGAGAFGGSRQGVQAGVTGSQYALGQAQMAAGLNQANFQQAQGAASSDIGTRLSADTTNATNGLNAAGLRLNAANSGIAGQTTANNQYMSQLMAALTGNSMVQGNQQQQNQQQADQLNAQNQLGTQRLGLQAGTLNGFQNVGGTTTGQQQQDQATGSGSVAGQAIGAGVGIASAAAMFF